MRQKTNRQSNKFLVALALMIGISCSSSGLAQSWPVRQVTLIYPYAAGSGLDIAWRIIGQEAAKSLGRPVIVENRPGAGGKLGGEAIVRAPRDGYTIGIFNSTVGIFLPVLDPGFRIEPIRDYQPIGLAFENYLVLLGNPAAPYKDFKGLIAYAKANPGKLNFGSSGSGTTGHVIIELIKLATGIDVAHIPFKGEAPMTTDVLSGQVQHAVGSTSAKQLVEAGKLLAIATTGPKRWSPYPVAPTFQELGIDEASLSSWQGLVAPTGVPAEATAKMNRALMVALQSPEVRKTMDDQGLVLLGGGAEEFTARIKSDLERMTKVARIASIKLD